MNFLQKFWTKILILAFFKKKLNYPSNPSSLPFDALILGGRVRFIDIKETQLIKGGLKNGNRRPKSETQAVDL